MAPQDGGTLHTEWTQMGPARSGLSFAIERMPEKEQKIVFVRRREIHAVHRAHVQGNRALMPSTARPDIGTVIAWNVHRGHRRPGGPGSAWV